MPIRDSSVQRTMPDVENGSRQIVESQKKSDIFLPNGNNNCTYLDAMAVKPMNACRLFVPRLAPTMNDYYRLFVLCLLSLTDSIRQCEFRDWKARSDDGGRHSRLGLQNVLLLADGLLCSWVAPNEEPIGLYKLQIVTDWNRLVQAS